ncbi:SDR family oxidoreductase [Trichlorobacter ammonificans]|uniref:NADP-dependent 3-hydroxy acid dehydrogenase YdfG n=1 Tax=Trichlorobacter ammonificans TaxID=2916410 RepID=A0ABM9D8Y6_9BACT|nr:SDR family oxidoreductase [Trichlorobacter ammonificans]CAH2031695.1 3-hydroxy acid dehydrogenase [Trichlorobacter ammonificans]
MSRTVFITGASSGFGAASARLFAQAGDRLVLAARRLEPLQALQEELQGQTEIHAVQLDVRDRVAVEQTVAGLPEPFRAIDILLNNAGLALGLEPAHQVSLDDWDTMIDTNIKGLTYCTRFILPGMVARNRGHVINIGSTAGAWPYAGGNVYGGTKAFVEQFTRNLRTDLQGTMVRATCIAPGMAETEFSNVRFKGDSARAARVYEGSTPLSAHDVASIIRWVADQPPHVNINTLEVMCIDQSWAPLAVHRTEKMPPVP